MAKTNPNYLVDTAFSAKNIVTAASVYAWTVAANCKVQIIVAMTIAGTGDYIAYLTHRWLGAGNVYVLLPKTTGTSAAGETIIEFATIPMHFKATDVVNVMVDGLGADSNISGVIRIVSEDPSIFEATDTVTLVTGITNAVKPDWAQIANPTTTVDLSGTTVKTATDIATILSGITSLAAWLRGMFRKDAMNAPAKVEINNGGGTYNEVTDSLEANRDNLGTTGAGLTTLPNATLADGYITAAKIATDAVNEIADGVWDEATAGHAVAGTTGKTLADASAAGDPWEAEVRTLTQTAAEVAAVLAGSTLTIQRGDTLSASFTALPTNTGYVSIDLTLKANPADSDDACILRIRKNASGLSDGLLRLNGIAPVSPVVAADASITVDSSTSLTVAIKARASAQLAPNAILYYDIQYIFATRVQTAAVGNGAIVQDITQLIA